MRPVSVFTAIAAGAAIFAAPAEAHFSTRVPSDTPSAVAANLGETLPSLDHPVVLESHRIAEEYWASRGGNGNCPAVTENLWTKFPGVFASVEVNWSWPDYAPAPACQVDWEAPALGLELGILDDPRLPSAERRYSAEVICRVSTHERGHTGGRALGSVSYDPATQHFTEVDGHPPTGVMSQRWKSEDVPEECKAMARRMVPRAQDIYVREAIVHTDENPGHWRRWKVVHPLPLTTHKRCLFQFNAKRRLFNDKATWQTTRKCR